MSAKQQANQRFGQLIKPDAFVFDSNLEYGARSFFGEKSSSVMVRRGRTTYLLWVPREVTQFFFDAYDK